MPGIVSGKDGEMNELEQEIMKMKKADIVRLFSEMVGEKAQLETKNAQLRSLLSGVLDEQEYGIPDRVISDTLENEISSALANGGRQTGCSNLETKNARLRQVLRPFVVYYMMQISQDEPDNKPITVGKHMSILTVGDIRNATREYYNTRET